MNLKGRFVLIIRYLDWLRSWLRHIKFLVTLSMQIKITEINIFYQAYVWPETSPNISRKIKMVDQTVHMNTRKI